MPMSSLGRDLLYLLTHKLRLITFPQVLQHLDHRDMDEHAQTRDEWQQLHRDGWLDVRTTLVHPLLPLRNPILSWQPDDPPPPLAAIARQLRKRWTSVPQPTLIGWATRKSSRRFGGYVGGVSPRRSETTHDAHLSEVFFRYRQSDPRVARRWISDRELVARGSRHGEAVPDALVPPLRRDSTALVIEFGGAYPRHKLEAFHSGFAHMRYELW